MDKWALTCQNDKAIGFDLVAIAERKVSGAATGIATCLVEWTSLNQRTQVKPPREEKSAIVKVLVLTRSTGEGHNRVAAAMREAFQARGHECDVWDALQIVGQDPKVPEVPVADGGKAHQHWVSDVSSHLYSWAVVKIPFMFGAVFNMGEVWCRTKVPSPVYIQNAKYADATQDFIVDNEYDVVVSTHTFPVETLSAIRRKYAAAVRCYGILTDYSYTPFFAEGDNDGFFIPHQDMMATCVKHRMPADRTYALGLPVAEVFQHPMDKQAARQQLGLPSDQPIYLLMAGGVGTPYTSQICDRLLSEGGESLYVTILTGRREDLFTAAARRYRDDPRVRVVPFTERVPAFMAAADIMISKPGAVSSTEAATIGLPLVHTGAIPGSEVKNARFFADRGMSLYNQNPAEAARIAQRLLHDPAGIARMRDHQRRTVVPDAAQRIVAKIEEDCS